MAWLAEMWLLHEVKLSFMPGKHYLSATISAREDIAHKEILREEHIWLEQVSGACAKTLK